MTSNLFTRYIIILGVIALSVFCIMGNWPVSLGIDLRGGSVLTYRIENIEGGEAEFANETEKEAAIEDTLEVISQRINKEGVRDITVRREGEYIVITLPDFTAQQTAEIRRRMTQMGRLELPIEAKAGDTNSQGLPFDEAKFEQERIEKKEAYVPPADFRWFPRRPERAETKGVPESEKSYRKRLAAYELKKNTEPWTLTGFYENGKPKGVWHFYDPDYWSEDLDESGFTGGDIVSPRRDYDSKGGRAVVYGVANARQAALGSYTSRYQGREMALVLNKEQWSAATIQSSLTDNVQITRGNGGYSETEQKWLLNCLQAGSLRLRPVLESQEQIGATLGQNAIERGEIAFAIGGIAVVAFMVFYYAFAGFLAVIALLLNFLFVFAVLMLLEASLTLPGIAGLVLTVGMAVDANILIFERIREELDKGKRLIHAAKNGFDRAFITIFDANLTTFIVAAFLVVYGKGPIKGFGYTLMTGIVCSMFAGLYITRTLLGSAIAKGWIKELKMRRLMTKPNFAFLDKSKKALTGSIIIIVLGLVAFFLTGDDKYGLDFNGGVAARMQFDQAMVDSDVKKAIAQIKGDDGKIKYQRISANAISPTDGKSSIIDVTMNYEAKDGKKTGEDGDGADAFEVVRGELLKVFGDKLVAEPLTDEAYADGSSTWSVVVHLQKKVATAQPLENAVTKAGFQNPKIDAIDTENKTWRISVPMSKEASVNAKAKVLEELVSNKNLGLTQPFPRVRFVGPAVVSGLKAAAFQAMIVSLLFILAYIWFRFKEIKYGLAASAALVHDVLICLGVAVVANKTNLVEVPISLNVIAAFLTIIGYSLNDTIVVFDRIRENLGSTRGTFPEIVNRSINQTLSRTVLTSATTFFVIASIFLANYGIESPLEGLAFVLLVGVVVGTYSSIFVASPVLIWAHKRDEEAQSKAKKPREVTSS